MGSVAALAVAALMTSQVRAKADPCVDLALAVAP